MATNPPIKIEIPASLSRKLEVKHLALYRILKAIIKATQTASIINGKFKDMRGSCYKCLTPLRADYTHHKNYCLDC